MPAHEEAQALLAQARAGHAEEQRRIAARVSECLDRAGTALEARAFDDAAAALDEVDALQRGSPDSAALRRRLVDERATAEAEAVLHRLVAEEIRHARAAFRRGRADEAVHQLRGFIEIEPRAEALGGELARLEQLRETLALEAAAARRVAAEHARRATQYAEMGLLDDAVASAQQALAADPTDVAAGALLDALLVRVFEARVEREKERLAQERLACAQPALDAARRALDAGYIEFASRAAAVAGCVAPASADVRMLADAAAEQMEGEDQDLVELGPTPFGSLASEVRVPPPAAGVAIEPLRLDRAIGMLKSVFSKNAPAAQKRQGDRR
jgi:tetratricopeptide (TPR) repeat protein